MKSKNDSFSRRSFLKSSVLLGSFFPVMQGDLLAGFCNSLEQPLNVSVFSKHLQFLNYQDMAEAAAEMGFDGVDLTVRPKGHVLPERVGEDLPRAIAAMKKASLSPLMMTTAVEDAESGVDRKVLETAASEGMQYYRMNWYNYIKGLRIPESVAVFRQKLKALGKLNAELGLTGCYQNHAGLRAGASMWELWEMLKMAGDHMGVQYDIRHAVVEGGLSWPNGLRLIHNKIKTLAVKDFKWEQKNGKWQVQNVPLGEGMVDFKKYFQFLKQYRIQVPVSLHLEYALGGAEHGATKLSCDKQIVFNAMKRDLHKLRDLWKQA